MALLFGMPEGITDAMESAFAAIQTAFGKLDGLGHWTYPAYVAGTYAIAGTGNSWTVPVSNHRLGYTVLGNTMCVQVYVTTSALVASGTAVTTLKVAIPAGYQAAGPGATDSAAGRLWTGHGQMINGGTAYPSRLYVNSAARFVNIERESGAVLVDDTAFYLEGSITFEIVPQV